jgi:hypothetical protein
MLLQLALPSTAPVAECDPPKQLADALPVLRRQGSPPFQLQLWGRNSSGRSAVEAFIANAYEREFAATVKVQFPTLIGLHDRSGRLRAAVGLRTARGEALFLEQYLGQPVELALNKFFDPPVSRDVIVELGSFASTGFTMSVYLLGAVSAYLATRGVEVALATATNKLNRLFAIFDLHTQVICPAGRAALQDQQTDWGSYYAADPHVVVGSTRQCLAAIVKSVASQNTPKRSAALACLIAQAQVHG